MSGFFGRVDSWRVVGPAMEAPHVVGPLRPRVPAEHPERSSQDRSQHAPESENKQETTQKEDSQDDHLGIGKVFVYPAAKQLKHETASLIAVEGLTKHLEFRK